MKPSTVLEQHRERIRRIVECHNARNARFFGSVLRNEDVEGSDLDILIDTTSETTLFDVGAIQAEISELLGVEVDVLTPGALPEKWKMDVLSRAQPV